MNPCPPSGPLEGCCLLQVPNTSSWQVVCTTVSGGPPAAVPAMSTTSVVLMAVTLALAALMTLRRS